MNDTVPTTGAIPFPRTGGTLPVPTLLTAVQADGLACVFCGRDFLTAPTARIPVGRSNTGSQVFACSTAGRQTCGAVEATVDQVTTVAASVDQDQDDTGDDTVPLRVLLDAAAEAMAGRSAEALRAMFGMVASVTYKTGRRDGYLTRMRDEHGRPDQTDAAKPSPVDGCPDWCAVHHIDPPDTVCHFTAESAVGGVPVWASRVITDGQTVEEVVSVRGETMTPATARTLAAAIIEAADRLDGAQ